MNVTVCRMGNRLQWICRILGHWEKRLWSRGITNFATVCRVCRQVNRCEVVWPRPS